MVKDHVHILAGLLIAIVSSVCISIGIIYFGNHLIEQKVEDQKAEHFQTSPPSGWKIISNGKEYSFVFPNGAVSLFRESSYKEAVNAAWVQFEYDLKREQQLKWPEVTKDRINN